jgi:L,D-transpeptidase catalytic domain
MRKALVLTLMVVVVVLAFGTVGNAYAYDQRAGALEQKWSDEQAAGVPRSEIDGLRGRLHQIESQRGGSIPFAITSLALVRDPLTDLENQTQTTYARILTRSKGDANAALQHLKLDYGPTPFDLNQRTRQLSAAVKPSDYQRLTRSWTAEAAQLEKVKSDLAAKAGGMSGELPADIVAGRDQLQQNSDKLKQVQMWTDPTDQTIGAVHQYLTTGYQAMLAQHDDLKNQLQAANDKVGHRLDLKTKSDDLIGALPGLLQYGKDGNYSSRAEKAKQDVAAAKDDGSLESSVGELQGVVNDLWQKKQQALQQLAAGSAGCVPGLAGKVILISLSRQSLVACEDGNPFLSTLVTTGRPGMETPQGSFAVSGKWQTYHMVSTCAKGTSCYYPPADVYYAMRFYGADYFLHTWPQGSYGPGTQYNTSVASHGCVHVPMSPAQNLYNWAPVGTSVVITG